MAPKASYNSDSIRILKGLEPIKKRPGMYTDTASPNHMIGEVIDNAQDEVLAGFADEVRVTRYSDGSIEIEDNGRGIPVDKHKKEKKYTAEVIFLVPHSGGKFSEGGSGPYKFSGGLHGVGVTVTNALSTKLQVTIYRKGVAYAVEFASGEVVSPFKKVGKAPPGKRGTKIRVWPDQTYFDMPIDVGRLKDSLKAKAMLLSGPRIIWVDGDQAPEVWENDAGLGAFLSKECAGHSGFVASAINVNSVIEETASSPFYAGEGVGLSMAVLTDAAHIKKSFVNLIPTYGGGSHEAGLKKSVCTTFVHAIEKANLTPQGVTIKPSDLWANLAFILSVNLTEPSFSGQTKEKMTSKRGKELVEKLVGDALSLWIAENKGEFLEIAKVVIDNASHRESGKLNRSIRKKYGKSSVLPGKLADCNSDKPSECELFLVEGDSAGGSIKQGRDREVQAVMPLKGKVVNTWDVSMSKMMGHKEPNDISVAMGIPPHNIDNAGSIDLSKLRYGKVFILADADIDGFHIQTLLLTLFTKHFPALVLNGKIWLAKPPLYRIDAPPKRGSKNAFEKFYALTEKDRTRILGSLRKRGVNMDKVSIQRFKGLGEMSPVQLKETTLSKKTRSAEVFKMGDYEEVVAAFNLMMGKKNVSDRKKWIEENGAAVERDV